MKYHIITACAAVLFTTFSMAQNSTTIGKELNNLAPPNSPAFVLMDVTPSTVITPESLQAFSIQTLSAFSGGDNDSTFRLDKRTGEISLTSSLDRERRSAYTLVVKRTRAADYLVPNIDVPFSEDDESLLKVIVEVEDVNDNPPQFAGTVKYLGT